MKSLRSLGLVAGVATIISVGCSDPADVPAQGGAYFNIGAPINPPEGANQCNTPGMIAEIKSGAQGVTAAGVRGLVEDGNDGATVSCTVRRIGKVEENGKAYAKYSINGSMSRGAISLNIVNAEVVETGGAETPITGSVRGTGVGEVSLYTPNTKQMSSTGGELCALKVLSVSSGKVWATFDCPVLKLSSQINTYCSVAPSSTFAFANCDS